MKKFFLILSILSILIAACGGQAIPENSEPTAPANLEIEAESNLPEPTAEPALKEAYPAQPEPAPLPEDGYPALEVDPYPSANDTEESASTEEESALIWVQKPMGVQCEDSGQIDEKKGIQSAVEALAAAGVQAKQWEITELMVTAVCGGPTSTHYRVEIPLSDLSTATNLNWIPE